MKYLTQIKLVILCFLTSLLCILSFNSLAVEWPQEVDTNEGIVTVYQPQPEILKGNQLTARAAMSFTVGDQDAIFGVFWFTAKIDTDRSEDKVTVRNIEVTRVHWPDSKDAGEQRFTAAVNNAISAAQLETSLSQLTASLESAEAAEKSLAELKNDAPEIIFSDKLAILLSFDGEAKFSAIENSTYERALNTSMAVVRDTKSSSIYLTSGDTWYQAEDVSGPYAVTESVPKDLMQMIPKSEEESSQSTTTPEVIVATKPTELIATDGKANWKSLAGGELMYVDNTETPWLRELSTNNMYILLSGRWFRGKEQKGPWTFVRADELPAVFAKIPPQSDLGGLRVSVAGTEEAEEALLDANVPQTSAISRTDAHLTVTYDGEPKFEKINGTALFYAVNTDAQVIVYNNIYYAVDNAVWFKSDNATGPWQVADEIPKQEIAKIPASSPLYNITYVDIYESTPEVVYVGYYPGYVGSYFYYGVPVYGTGWYYPPYWGGGHYYPRPPTWGFNAGYNNWAGWHFGVSWSNGFFNVGMNWNAGYHGGHHPPHPNGMHGRPGPVVINTGNINIGNNVNIGDHQHDFGQIGSGQFGLDQHGRIDNLYKLTENSKRNASASQVKQNLKVARSNNQKENNVFAEKDGNVVKLDNDKWQQRTDGKWQELDTQQQQQVKDKVSTIDAQQVKERVNQVNTDKVRSSVTTHSTQQTQFVNPSMSHGQVHTQSSQRVQHLNNASHARQQGAHRQQTRQAVRSGQRSLPKRAH